MVKGFTGAKTPAFCHWLFACMGLLEGDSFDDIFPGTGAVARAWDSYARQPQLGVPMHPAKMDQTSFAGEIEGEGGRTP
jgi:hypothetical protein